MRENRKRYCSAFFIVCLLLLPMSQASSVPAEAGMRAELNADPSIPANLENPRPASSQSGITVISGWVCNANRVDIEIDGSLTLQAAYGTWRPDTEPVCGDSNNGFGLLYNMNHLSNGVHSLCALADGVSIGCADFTVTTLGQDYLRGASGIYPLPNFPFPNQTTVLRWEESVQNFVIGGFDAGSSAGAMSNEADLDKQFPPLSLFGILAPPIFGVIAPLKTAKTGARTDLKNACFLPLSQGDFLTLQPPVLGSDSFLPQG